MAEAGFELWASSQYYPAMFQTGFPQWPRLTLRTDSAPLSYCKWNALKKFLAILKGMWDLTSLTRDRTPHPALETLESYPLESQGIPVNEMLLEVEML